MRHILDSMNDYILVLDMNGNIKYYNKKLLSKIKIEEKELINKNIDNIADIDISIINSEIKNNKNEDEKRIDINIYYNSKNITKLKCNVLIDKFEGEESIFIIGEELYDQSYTKQDLEILLDNIPFSAWIKEPNGKYRYANESYAKICGGSKKEIIGMSDSDYWDESECNIFDKIDRHIIKSKTPMLYDEAIEINGRKEHLEIFKAPIFDKNDQLLYTIGNTRNVTIEKKLTEGIASSNQNIVQIQDILNNGDSDLEVNDALYDICKELCEFVGTDSISLFKYEEASGDLIRTIHFGKFVNSNNEKFYNLSYLDSIEVLKKGDYEGIKHVDEIRCPHIRLAMKEHNINYLGIYNIMFKDQFLGMLILKYFNDNKIKVNMDDNIKAICSHIGLHMKNISLSEEVKSELARRVETENELEDFIEISVDLMAKVNLEGEILMANGQCEYSLGWNEEELLNINLKNILNLQDINLEFKDVIKAGKTYNRGITKIKNKFGEDKTLQWNYKVIREKNHLLVTAKDITNQVIEEENKRKLEEAIKLESFKNEFFANISHEFKTPLNIILGAIQLISKNLQDNNLSEQAIYIRYIKPIRQNSYRLLRLVNNLIDITRIDTGFYELQQGNYDIVNIVENITLSVAGYIEDKGINLVFDTNCEEKVIACDPDKIERIMLNLLSNSIKYTSINGNIFVDLNISDDKVVVSVEDNGIGIELEKLETIFERFKQVDNILTRKCEGSGIGLSLVKSLVELHGGEIEVYSEVNKGTKFVFELPIKVIENDKNKQIYELSDGSMQIEKCNIEFSDIYV